MESIHHAKLKLKVDEAKSAVARPQERKFLGFSFTAGPEVKRVIAPKALDRFRQRVRGITRRAKGVSLKTTMEELALYMRGWRSYLPRLASNTADSGDGPWYLARAQALAFGLSNAYFRSLGLPSLFEEC